MVSVVLGPVGAKRVKTMHSIAYLLLAVCGMGRYGRLGPGMREDRALVRRCPYAPTGVLMGNCLGSTWK